MVGRLTVQLDNQVGPTKNQQDCVLQGFQDTAKQLEQPSWDNSGDDLDNQEMRHWLARLRGYNDEDDELSKREDEIFKTFFTETEDREIGNIMTVEQVCAIGKSNHLNNLERQKIHFELKEMDAREEGELNRQREFKKEVLRLKTQEDMVTLALHELLENEKIEELLNENIRENNLTRLDHFKKWAKENLIGLCGVAILSILSTCKLAKALKEVSAKLAPFLGSFLSLVGTIALLGAKVVGWLSKNLWLLALFITYLVYKDISGHVKKSKSLGIFSFFTKKKIK